ncbi:hypothetical protein N0A02_30305 [Paraburkholderia acidicola]|uniref:Uncharacterized protein n=1 Tax=Paraburkholderia acidicola TaxID=1912599 RepID=A0ABV1LWR1_9BURK
MIRAHVIDGVTYFCAKAARARKINPGGERIGGEEVDALLSRHPAVPDAKRVAMPDLFYGAKDRMFPVLRERRATPDIPQKVEFLSSQALASLSIRSTLRSWTCFR